MLFGSSFVGSISALKSQWYICTPPALTPKHSSFFPYYVRMCVYLFIYLFVYLFMYVYTYVCVCMDVLSVVKLTAVFPQTAQRSLSL